MSVLTSDKYSVRSNTAHCGRDRNFSVVAEGLSKQFCLGANSVSALRDVSISVQKGEFVAIMGASGCGKSTLLHVLSGLTLPSAGSVVVDGIDLSGLSDSQLTKFRRRKIGLVFQAFNLIPSLSAVQNITLPIIADGSVVDEAILERLMQRLGLSNRRNHRPNALSGGEQQRVAIARALITNPAIILADEPTGSLDSVNGQTICQLLKELCIEHSTSIAVVTHEPAVARWASRVVLMRDGQILSNFETADFPNANLIAAHYQNMVNEG